MDYIPTTNQQTRDLIANSKLKQQKRFARLAFALLVIFALVFAYTRYNIEHAKQYKLEALQAQHQALLNSNATTDKAITTLKQIKALTTNYQNN